MKKVIITAVLLVFGLTMNAQNKQVTKESTTTRVTVNDGTKPRQVTRTESTEAVQNVELHDAESNKLNKDIKPTPVQVQKSTTVSGTGIPAQEIDRASYYQFNGQNYQFISDNSGYRIASPDNTSMGVLRRTSNNNYIYRTKDRVSVGHFDENGNFVVESYDDKTDGVTVETYTRVKQ
jgi:hypothetical protein